MLLLKSPKSSIFPLFCLLLLLAGAVPAQAQTLIALDDEFSIPFGILLEVEPFGVLDNDLLDGENAGESGATAELVTGVAHGTLVLSPNGSFTYSPGVTFDGTDSFVYRAVFDTVSDQATVTLTACTGGPDVFVCWNETVFLAKAAQYGYSSFQEGFETDLMWGPSRSPLTTPGVVSQGVPLQGLPPNAISIIRRSTACITMDSWGS